MTNFEKSEHYKKALAEFQKEVFWNILKPLHIIIINDDLVYLFYNQSIVQDIFEKIKQIYNKNEEWNETNFPVSLWYEEPEIRRINFMWNEYKIISLWYDKSDVPREFKAKI
jgi:hypothetical protein